MSETLGMRPASTAAPIKVMEPATEVTREVTLEVEGTLPQELRGTLYRNGPAMFEHGGFYADHLFDGDGMVSKFVIDSGQVRFQSRYVRTSKFRLGEEGRGDRVRGVWTKAAVGLGNGRVPADSANTHAVVHADRLLALSDAGRPWELDLDDLTTRGRCTFDGALPRLSRFSPHPKIDPLTGEMFNFGLDIAPPRNRKTPMPAALRCYRVTPQGRLSTMATVPLRHVTIVHDFAITERYLVFALVPITVDPRAAWMALFGRGSFGDAASYRPELGVTIVLVPRDGGKQRVIESEALMFVHINNAYEDSGDLVLDVVRHDGYDLLGAVLKDFRTVEPTGGWPARLRITAGGKVRVEDLPAPALEFPTHDERRTGQPYQHAYFASYDANRQVGGIVKLDQHTGSVVTHEYSGGEKPGEPVFVPRHDRAAEDDGWLLSVTYLSAEHHTALTIHDAQHVDAGPVAIARTQGHFFPGFHGSFTQRVAATARPTP